MNSVLYRLPAIVAALLVAIIANAAPVEAVRVRDGNVELVKNNQADMRLTNNGKVVEALLSPDGKTIAFIVMTPDKYVFSGAGKSQANELWVMGADGTGANKILEGRENESPERILSGFTSLRFSPKGDIVFFLSSAWATSNAIHAINLKSGRETFICDGNTLRVIYSGKHKGDLVISKHRYKTGGGSYDWLWLVTPSGRDIKVFSRTGWKPQ